MKLVIVAVVVVGLIISRRMYRQWQARIQRPVARSPRVPTELLDGAERTWVVFTTPYCASCGPVSPKIRCA